MAAFIVISADNRLHHLVDGIVSCRPLNGDVSVSLSTGMIIDVDGNLTYKYTISGGDSSKGDKKNFSTIFANQLAQFRLQCHIANNDIVNIFLLENPLTEDDFEKGQWWQEEIQKVYECGHDKAFRLFRVLFTYDIETPADVVSQVPIEHLTHILSNSNNADLEFDSFIFYIDNQKSDAAAMFESKEDHDLKMPRMLCDFMMLASSNDDSYGVLQSIQNVEAGNRVFSVGYAESMYYYDDVKRYFLLADTHDLHYRMLHGKDETSSEIKDKDRMRADRYPFGLYERKQTMYPLYEDVPFSEDINDYPKSADKTIDDCLLKLQDVIVAERDQELQEFLKSEPIASLIAKKDIIQEEYEAFLNTPQDERDVDYDTARNAKEQELEVIGNQIAELNDTFEPECPEFVSRNDIYTKVNSFEEEEEQIEYLSDATSNYQKLVDFVRRSGFADFIKQYNEEIVPICGKMTNEDNEERPNGFWNSGCWSKLFFWRKKTHTEDVPAPIITSAKADPVVFAGDKDIDFLKLQKNIVKCLQHKKQYKVFSSDVEAIELLTKEEKSRMKKFCLSDHTSHHYHLINLKSLKEFHEKESKERLDSTIDHWRTEVVKDMQTRTSIEQWVESASKSYVERFQFVNWEEPFVFVNKLTNHNIPRIINELNKMSAPCANYYKVTTIAQNVISKIAYSDNAEICSLFNTNKNKIVESNSIRAVESRHASSKVCFMQFLPMDESIIEVLTDLRNPEGMMVGNGEVVQEPNFEPSELLEVATDDKTAEPVIDWGEKS